MTRDYDNTFTCARGMKWVVRFKLSQITRFCGEYGIKMERIMPEYLNEEQLLRLSHIGIQHHADAKGIDFDMWLDDHLEGEAHGRCRDATQFGILNFILPRLPENRRVALRKVIDDTLRDSRTTDDDSTSFETDSEAGGPGQTSPGSPSPQDSTPTTPPTV